MVATDSETVRSALRSAILNGTYAPRQRLIEAEVADLHGASRFVVRNVLMRLAADGLVEIQPNRGARVREISVDEAIEITEIRRAVEGVVAARAARRLSDDEAQELQELSRAMADAVAAGELMRYSDLNASLHVRLRVVAAHTHASRIIEQLNAQMVRHQFRLALVPGRPRISLAEHQAVIEAVCARDPEAAEDAMRAHIGSVMIALETFRQQDGGRADA